MAYQKNIDNELKVYDLDGNGVITPREYIQVHPGMSSTYAKQLIINRGGRNGVELTRDDLCTFFSQVFSF